MAIDDEAIMFLQPQSVADGMGVRVVTSGLVPGEFGMTRIWQAMAERTGWRVNAFREVGP